MQAVDLPERVEIPRAQALDQLGLAPVDQASSSLPRHDR